MAILDRNDFFYTALRVAVAQNKNPDWIFKTNLLHIDNVAQKIYSDTRIRPNINLESVYDYLDKETPFHVHFENFAIQYTKNDEVVIADVNDEHTIYVEIGYHNVTEYPTTLGYDNLPYDFEYPGLGTYGLDYDKYNASFAYNPLKEPLAGWYPFKNPPIGIYSDPTVRNACTRGELDEDPACASYDYTPTPNEFKYVLETYNKHNNTNLTSEELQRIMFKDPYFYENSANYLYILNQNQTFAWVRDKLYNNFKGVVIHGGKNDNDRNGYESNEYDEQLYDYITYENKYYISDAIGNVSDWFLEENSKFNINKIVPSDTTRFYTPETPFATKKLNVYLDEKNKADNFSYFGLAHVENDWLVDFEDKSSYAALKQAFNVNKRSWEITLDVRVDNDKPVIYNKDSRFTDRLISVLGSYYNKYSVPQLYIIEDIIYLDVSTNGENYDVRLYKKGIKKGETYVVTIGYDTQSYYLHVSGDLAPDIESGGSYPESITIKQPYDSLDLYKPDRTGLGRFYISEDTIISTTEYVPTYTDYNLTNIGNIKIKAVGSEIPEPREESGSILFRDCLYYHNIEQQMRECENYIEFLETPYDKVIIEIGEESSSNSEVIEGYIALNTKISDTEYTPIYFDKELSILLCNIKSTRLGGIYFTEQQRSNGLTTVEGNGLYYKIEGRVSNCYIKRERTGYPCYSGLVSRNIETKTEQIYTPNDPIVESNSSNPIYYDRQSVLRLGDSTFRQENVSFIPFHYIGGVYDYRAGQPEYDKATNSIYVPPITMIVPVSKNKMVKITVRNYTDLPRRANDGIVAYVSNEGKKYICYNNIWTEYTENEYVEQLAIVETNGNIEPITYYVMQKPADEIVNTVSQLPTPSPDVPEKIIYYVKSIKKKFQFRYDEDHPQGAWFEYDDFYAILLKNKSTASYINIPEDIDNNHSGLLVFNNERIDVVVADYIGKYYNEQVDNEPTLINDYPVYYFNTFTDSFYYKNSATGNWVEQYNFTIMGKVLASANNTYVLRLFPTFEESPDIRYLSNNASIDIDSFDFIYNGRSIISYGNDYRHLKLNRDYNIKVDSNYKEYIELLDSNGAIRTLKQDSVLQIDCLDYDYLYDVVYGNRDNENHEFTRYKSYLGTFASLADLVSKSGSIKVKLHDYFYNTTTRSVWILDYAGNYLDINTNINTPEVEFEINLNNYTEDIYEVLEFKFGWRNTNLGLDQFQEDDLALIRGTKLLRPNHTAKGSEEIRTSVRDGVIIDMIEDIAYLDIDGLEISPTIMSESLRKGNNIEIATNILVNSDIMKFVEGKYIDTPIKWRSKTGLKKLPDYQLKPFVSINNVNNKFIEFERDNIEIVFSHILYEQTVREFKVQVDSYIDTSNVTLTFDGRVIEQGTDYLLYVDEHNLMSFNIINGDLYDEGESYCYGVYVTKSPKYVLSHKEEVPELPYELHIKTDNANQAILNNMALFDVNGKKLQAPYMKWYYVDTPTTSFELPVNDGNSSDITHFEVYIGNGHRLDTLLRVQSSEYTINGNIITFSHPIPANLSVGVIITTHDTYRINIMYNNGNYIIDYALNYIIDYFNNNLVDFGHDTGSGEATITILSDRDLNPKTLFYYDYYSKLNLRLDVYQKKTNNEYMISSDYFDKKSVNVWKNGILLSDSEFTVIGNIVYLYTNVEDPNDVIQIWYKVNRTIKASEHNKYIISDTNSIYNLMNLPTVETFLVKEFDSNDVKMYVDRANYLTQPVIDENNYYNSHPGRIQIGNEILEFWSIDYYDKIPGTDTPCHSLSGFVRGIKGSTYHGESNPYPIGTGIQDIGMRYETMISHTKNKNSRIEYQYVEQNWKDPEEKQDDPEIPEYEYDNSIPRFTNRSLMPWYNIPGEVEDNADVSVWKTELVKIVNDYNPETDIILDVDSDKNIQNITNYNYKTPIGSFTEDANGLIEYRGLYYKSGFVSDNINIVLFNEIEEKSYSNIRISGSLDEAASKINNTVDNDILVCSAVYDELVEKSHMVFNLKKGYSMKIVENDNDKSFFIQELWGGILKSTNGNVNEVDLHIGGNNGITMVIGDERYNFVFKAPSGGKSTIERLIDDVNDNRIFSKTKVWMALKTNSSISNITQLNIVNYGENEVLFENYGNSYIDNLGKIGIARILPSCSYLNSENENGEIDIINEHTGYIDIEGTKYTFGSINYHEDYVSLIGIHIDRALDAGYEFFGSALIKQELEKDYYIEFNAIKFYERLPIGTLLKIQNKDIIVSPAANSLHNHNLDE